MLDKFVAERYIVVVAEQVEIMVGGLLRNYGMGIKANEFLRTSFLLYRKL